MSLDFDRFPDGEPAGQAQVPAQQAPATTEQEPTASPSFTPKHAAGEPAGDELAGDEPTVPGPAPDGEPVAGEPVAGEPVTGEPEPAGYGRESAAYEPTAARPVVPGSVVGDPGTAGPADGELADHEIADDELADGGPAAAEPVLADPAEADEPVAAGAAPAAAAASEATAYQSSAAPAWDAEGAGAVGDVAGAGPGREVGTTSAASLDGPLLGDTDELQASWQRIQVAFIDNPREAVADAAGLVDQMGQMLVSALRQRQQQLRAMWDRNGTPDGVDYADSGSPTDTVSPGRDRLAADGGTDTEQLRLLIRQYRALFNELCRP